MFFLKTAQVHVLRQVRLTPQQLTFLLAVCMLRSMVQLMAKQNPLMQI